MRMQVTSTEGDAADTRVGWVYYAALIGGALLLTIIFTFVLMSYYRSFHAGVGAGVSALVIGTPAAFTVALLAGLGRASTRRPLQGSPDSLGDRRDGSRAQRIVRRRMNPNVGGS
jgi:hypothetical protein